MTVRVPVQEKLLTWAIERAGYAVEQFLAAQPKAGPWLSGEKQPTLRQLENLAKKLNVPFGYLLLPEPPEEAPILPMFRTAGTGTPGVPPPVRDTILLIKQRQEWLSEYLADNGAEPLPFIASATGDVSPLELAERMRVVLGLGADQPIRKGKPADTLRTLTNRLEAIGVQVAYSGVVGNNTHRPIPVDDCRGFVLLDAYAPFIFINNADAKAAQLFTLVHEFAHLLLGHEGVIDLQHLLPADDPLEKLCNAAAAEFLVPEQVLTVQWAKAPDIDKLARSFGVSQVVIGRRLLDLGIWNRSTFFTFYAEQQAIWQAFRKKQSSGGGGDFYAGKTLKVGRGFLSHVDTAVRSGALTYGEAYRLTGTNRSTYEKLTSGKTKNGG